MWKPIYFDTQLKFPAREGLFLQNFTSTTNLFEHSFDNLRGKVRFDTVSVKGQMNPFVAKVGDRFHSAYKVMSNLSKGLDVGELSVYTSVKAISGHNINATRAVTFQTTLA
jgi:hypothetical protein